MAKRSSRGRQQLRSAKSARNQDGNRRGDDLDWNISSGEESGEEDVVLNSASDHSREGETEEAKETVEEKKLRLAKEYLNKVRLEEEEASESDLTDEEGVEERIEKRLQREAEEVWFVGCSDVVSWSCVQRSGFAAERCRSSRRTVLQGPLGCLWLFL